MPKELRIFPLSELPKAEGDILIIAYPELARSAAEKLNLPEDSLELIAALAEKHRDETSSKLYRTERLYAKRVQSLSLICLTHTRSRNLPKHDVLGLRELLSSSLLDKACTVLVALDCDCPEAQAAIVAELSRALPRYQRKLKERQRAHEREEIRCAFLSQKPSTPAELKRLNCATEALTSAAALIDTPTLELNTEVFAKEILAVAQKYKLDYDCIEGEALLQQGFGGLHHVGKAARPGPKLIVVHYKGQGNPHRLALVGKGIVYDTGGLSLKPRDAMTTMKTDMSGAAAVFGAMQLIVDTGVDCQVDFIFCLAENAIGHEALRPDDIIQLYSGLTVEVNNTDAEGRLVLADGVAYASRHLSPELIVDIATLTGAQLICTGKNVAGLLCSDEAIEKMILDAGRHSGDPVFPLLYAPEILLDEFKCEAADMLNTNKDRFNASSSCAGHFIEKHLDEKYQGQFAHIDMAGPARRAERGTAFGVMLLDAVVRRFAQR